MDYYGNDNGNQNGGYSHDPFAPGNGPSFQGSGFEGPNFDGGGPRGKKPRKPLSVKQKSTLKVVALCLVCALVGGLAHPVYNAVTGGNGTTIYTGNRTPTKVDTAAVNTEKELTTAEIYAKYVSSCVGITVDIVSTNIFGQTVTGAAAGSGFVITEDGYILTNYHVIDGANSIKVTFSDGKEYTATYVGGEEANDIAVIKVEATGLTPVVIGSSSDMLVGEQVTTIGNPLGELTFSETTGIISALDRTITMSDGNKMNMIQTDCAINSGNSGGALFNLYGEVIGITNAKYSSSGSSSEASIDNIGFAIPIDQVRSIFESIITNGYIVKPYIGVTVSDVSSESQSYGLPQGAAVRSVTENGPAAEAGLQENDIITAVNGETITGSNDLVKLVKASAAGDTLELTVYRQGQTTTLTLTVGEQKTDALPAQTTDQNQQSQQSYYDGGQSGQSDNQFGGSWPFGFGFGG